MAYIVLALILSVCMLIYGVISEKRKIQEKRDAAMRARLYELSNHVRSAKRSDTAQRRIDAMEQEIDRVRGLAPSDFIAECDRNLRSVQAYKQRLLQQEHEKKAETQRRQAEREQQKKAERRIAKWHKHLHTPSSLPDLASVLEEARAECSSVHGVMVDKQHMEMLCEIDYMLRSSDTEILNRYMDKRFDSLCASALGILSVEEFSKKLRTLFAECNRCSAPLPAETIAHLETIRDKVGLTNG